MTPPPLQETPKTHTHTERESYEIGRGKKSETITWRFCTVNWIDEPRRRPRRDSALVGECRAVPSESNDRGRGSGDLIGEMAFWRKRRCGGRGSEDGG